MTRKEQLVLTAVWRDGGCSDSYDSFVVGSIAVLRLKFCAKNPQLRQAAKRLNDEILPKSLRINKVNKVLYLWGFSATKVKKWK